MLILQHRSSPIHSEIFFQLRLVSREICSLLGLPLARFGYIKLLVEHHSLLVVGILMGYGPSLSVLMGRHLPVAVMTRVSACGRSVLVTVSKRCKAIPIGLDPLLSPPMEESLPAVAT